MKYRDHVRFQRRGSRARRQRREHDRQWWVAARRMSAGKPWFIYWAPPADTPTLREEYLEAWPKGWVSLGAIDDQPPPARRPGKPPETEGGERLKDFHRGRSLGRGFVADFAIVDEPWGDDR